MNRLKTAIMITSTMISFALSSSFDAVAAPPDVSRETRIDRAAELSRIVAVLDRRIDDSIARRNLLDKLVRLNDQRVHLIASLAERLEADAHRPATGIALLLIAALLITS